jgi:hypothetical protein
VNPDDSPARARERRRSRSHHKHLMKRPSSGRGSPAFTTDSNFTRTSKPSNANVSAVVAGMIKECQGERGCPDVAGPVIDSLLSRRTRRGPFPRVSVCPRADTGALGTPGGSAASRAAGRELRIEPPWRRRPPDGSHSLVTLCHQPVRPSTPPAWNLNDVSDSVRG